LVKKSQYWLNNGKLSDISCAYLIDRLESTGTWAPLYAEQQARIVKLAIGSGLLPLINPEKSQPFTSVPFLAPQPMGRENLELSRNLTFAKYYQPISQTPNARFIFERIVNIPSHPDVAKLTDRAVLDDMNLCRRSDVC